MLSESDPRHGSENAYNHYACRCDLCIDAHKVYMVDYRRKVAAKRFLSKYGDDLILLAQFLPLSSDADQCWIYGEHNPIQRRHVRELLYSVSTGRIAPRLDRSQGARRSLRMPCDSRCVRPEHIKVLTEGTPQEEGIFHLKGKQKRILAAFSYMPEGLCWLLSQQQATREYIDRMRKSVSDLTGHLKRMGTCGAYNCLNPQHFAYENSVSAYIPDSAVRFNIPRDLVNPWHPFYSGEPTQPKTVTASDAKKVSISPSPALLAGSKRPNSLYDRLSSAKDLTKKEVGRRIQEFTKRISEDLNARAEYSGCLTGKVVYGSEDDAQAAVVIWKSLSLDLFSPARAYKCHKCRFWHLTSKERWSALDGSRSLASILSH